MSAISNTKEDPRELMPESEGSKALKVCANPLIHNTIHTCMHTYIHATRDLSQQQVNKEMEVVDPKEESGCGHTK